MYFVKVKRECIVDKEVQVSRFVGDNCTKELKSIIKKIIWYGTIKPGISKVDASISDTQRYEEIQLLEVEIQDRQQLFDVGKVIFSSVKYPCIVEFSMDDVISIGCCTFSPGKKDYSENVNKSMVFSHFLHRDLISPQAKKMVDQINDALSEERVSIGDIYSKVKGRILDYKLGGMSRDHVDRLIVDMLGKTPSGRKAEIRKYCIPYEYHQPIVGSGKYGNKRKFSNYTLVHDFEEVWYCFMKDLQVRSMIEKRGYRDMEHLVFAIDSKGW